MHVRWTRLTLAAILLATAACGINGEFIANPRPPISLPKVDIPSDLIEKLELNNTQPELAAAADEGRIPADLDDRQRIRANVAELVTRAREFDLVNERLRLK